jgi:hypothetical protein
MKKLILTSFASVITSLTFGQTDTIFSNNERILCSVKEITPEAVKFSYPDEELINTVYKNTVQKIVFKSGRIQTFAESTSYKRISSVDDFENVTLTKVESEIKGLFKLGDVSSKAKGTTTLSNQERVKERAYRKMKIVAAMMGANIVYLTDQRSDGNQVGTKYQAGKSAETSLSGVAYTNQLPNIEEFKNTIGERRSFRTVEMSKLWSSDSDMTKTYEEGSFVINSIQNENGLIMVNGDLQDQSKYHSFRVVSFDNKYFNIYYEDKSTSYNIKVRI